MLKALLARARQGHRTTRFPDGPPPALPAHFRGAPQFDPSRCPSGCRTCADACPTAAIRLDGGSPALDLGRCIFCPECESACPEGAISFTDDYRLNLQRIIEARVSGEEIALPQAPEPEASGVIDLVATLRASLAARQAA